MDKCTIYLNNLAYTRDEKGIRHICSRYGKVKMVKIVIDFKTEQSKGMAFVEMDSPEAAEKAIKGLNGAVIDGRTLKAKYATPQGSKARLKTQYQGAAAKKTAKPDKKPKKAAPRPPKKSGLEKLFDFLKPKKD